jgi:protein-S-isoprenylcysteine O-methyltransferase Ste14
MELFPELEIGWRNGWLLIVLLYATYSILLMIFPKDVVARLHDKPGRNKTHRRRILMGSMMAFAYFALIIFTPLKIGSAVFIPGLTVFVLGSAGFVIALFDFRNTPLNEPATQGLYGISRHPQQLMFFIAFMGICIAVGSWVALFVQLFSSIFLHQRVLAEEKACFERYGEEYQKYKKRTPRYFLFF